MPESCLAFYSSQTLQITPRDSVLDEIVVIVISEMEVKSAIEDWQEYDQQRNGEESYQQDRSNVAEQPLCENTPEYQPYHQGGAQARDQKLEQSTAHVTHTNRRTPAVATGQSKPEHLPSTGPIIRIKRRHLCIHRPTPCV